jgi:hypothetical protein
VAARPGSRSASGQLPQGDFVDLMVAPLPLDEQRHDPTDQVVWHGIRGANWNPAPYMFGHINSNQAELEDDLLSALLGERALPARRACSTSS